MDKTNGWSSCEIFNYAFSRLGRTEMVTHAFSRNPQSPINLRGLQARREHEQWEEQRRGGTRSNLSITSPALAQTCPCGWGWPRCPAEHRCSLLSCPSCLFHASKILSQWQQPCSREAMLCSEHGWHKQQYLRALDLPDSGWKAAQQSWYLPLVCLAWKVNVTKESVYEFQPAFGKATR